MMVLYNQGVSAKLNQNSRLKDACQLTEASWAVFVYREDDEWRLESVGLVPKAHQVALQLALNQTAIAKWLSGVSVVGRSGQHSVLGLEGFGCERVYVFAVSVHRLALIGVNGKLDSHKQRIWKLAVFIDKDTPIWPAEEDVDLLQHTVLELQQTQQELQARISAQREAEARLIQAAKLAAVGEMAAGVAHELNNPLTSVVGFTELALDELPVDSTVRSDLELVLKEARRARSVVRRLLDFARQAETMRVKADLNEIVDDVLALTKHLMRTSNVQPVIRLGKNLAWVLVDRNQIKQVVINLINNALYAMPEGGQLEVETAEQSRFGRPWLALSIRDTGIGIPPENMERIFEPFFTTRGDRGGTGLGLSVTYGIVTDHGGMIEVESQLKVGSTFVVWLPLDQPV